MDYFNPARLRLARRRRGMTKTALANAVGVTPRSISSYESDSEAQQPSAGTAARLSEVLEFPTAFFFGEDPDELALDGASFRALSRMTQKQRDQATAAGELAFMLSDWIEERFDLPTPNVPQLRGATPEAAAEHVRSEWGLGELPCGNMIHLLEAHGVRVFSLAKESREVDAFSCWRLREGAQASTPYIFLNTLKSGERSRMDASHELGHLVLHWRHEVGRGREAEQEANAFASAFLMPEGSVLARAPRSGSLSQIIQAKQYWRVSAGALVYRMHKLGMLSRWQYQTLFKQMGGEGYLKKEPNGIERETSQVLDKVLRALRSEGVTKSDISHDLHVSLEDLNKLIFGLALSAMDGRGDDSEGRGSRSRSHLRLV